MDGCDIISWEQLLDITREAREYAEAEREEEPTACPNDGEPLERDPNGRLRCHFDGWIYRG